MLASARMTSSRQSPNILASQDVWPPTMLARPGAPRDPKSHLFAAKWVAVAPFGTWGPGAHAEFRRESCQGGPAPSISTYVFTILEYKNAQMQFFGNLLKPDCPRRGGFGALWGGQHPGMPGCLGPICLSNILAYPAVCDVP